MKIIDFYELIMSHNALELSVVQTFVCIQVIIFKGKKKAHTIFHCNVYIFQGKNISSLNFFTMYENTKCYYRSIQLEICYIWHLLLITLTLLNPTVRSLYHQYSVRPACSSMQSITGFILLADQHEASIQQVKG